MPVTEDTKPNDNLGGFANYRQKYSSMKTKLKAILYENELFQDELRKLQRELLDIYRDKETLLERVIQYEDIDSSSSDSENQSSDNECEIESIRNESQVVVPTDNDKQKTVPASKKRTSTPPLNVKTAKRTSNGSISNNVGSKLSTNGNPDASNSKPAAKPKAVSRNRKATNNSNKNGSKVNNNIVPVQLNNDVTHLQQQQQQQQHVMQNHLISNHNDLQTIATQGIESLQHPQPIITTSSNQVFEQQGGYTIVASNDPGNLMHSQQAQCLPQVVTIHQPPQRIHVMNPQQQHQQAPSTHQVVTNGHIVSHQPQVFADVSSPAGVNMGKKTATTKPKAPSRSRSKANANTSNAKTNKNGSKTNQNNVKNTNARSNQKQQTVANQIQPQAPMTVISHVQVPISTNQINLIGQVTPVETSMSNNLVPPIQTLLGQPNHNANHFQQQQHIHHRQQPIMTTSSNQPFEQQGYTIVASNNSGTLMHSQQAQPMSQFVTIHQPPSRMNIMSPQHQLQASTNHQIVSSNGHMMSHQAQSISESVAIDQIDHGINQGCSTPQDVINSLNNSGHQQQRHATDPSQQQSNHISEQNQQDLNLQQNNTFSIQHLTTEQLSAEELEQHLESRRMEQAAMLLPDWESSVPSEIFSTDSAIKFMAED